MVSEDEDAMVCDFAQYYHCHNWRELPLHIAAALAFGLPPESRSKMRLSGLKAAPRTLMLAAIVDYLALSLWRETEDGRHGRNPPSSFLKSLLGAAQENKSEIAAFASGEDFEKRRAEIISKGGL